MDGSCLQFEENPIQDAISRIRFAPASNNLLISSWDTNLRLYDVDRSRSIFEASGEAALLDCCFQGESAAFSAASDCSITRYDLHSGMRENFGNHDDLATCVEYSNETGQVVTAGWDKKIKCWDSRSTKTLTAVNTVNTGVKSISLCGFASMVAVGDSVNIYDLRKFNKSFNSKCVEIQIECVRPYLDQGFAAGSTDGRVALKYFNPSDQNNDGYAFRCHPKAKRARHNFAAVNDIAFSPSTYGDFVTGDNKGYVTIWNAQSKKRVYEMPKFENSIASLSYSHGGQFLAVASSYTYSEENELEMPPRIYIHEMDDKYIASFSTGTIVPTHCFNQSFKLKRNALKKLKKKIKKREGIFCLIFENMSDEEHQFESKADAGASKTFPQQAGTIRKNGYIVIKNRACKVVEVSTSKTGKHGHAKCHFVAIDIFNGKKLEDIVPSSHNCDVPHVNRTDYQLIDISEDGFVSLLTENGGTKDDLKLPTDDSLLTQIKDGFAEGKDLVVTVMSAMGEEQICALKDIGPK
ncbi:mitotic checkpoint protein BUB3.3 [Lactuca sativa]|nr:mitotic checkpoint protein BUB3.3 [Lactuca sativa]